MVRTRELFVAAFVLGVAAAAHSTTVGTVPLDEMIATADVIFVGEVVDRTSAWDSSSEGRRIVTRATFDVLKVWKGRIGLRTQLTFLGGTIDDTSLDVPGVPRFEVGDRDVLLLAAGRQAVSPLVGVWQGRFRIVRDPATGTPMVRAHDGAPMFDGLGIAANRTQTRAQPLTLDGFEALIQRRLEAVQRRR